MRLSTVMRAAYLACKYFAQGRWPMIRHAWWIAEFEDAE